MNPGANHGPESRGAGSPGMAGSILKRAQLLNLRPIERVKRKDGNVDRQIKPCGSFLGVFPDHPEREGTHFSTSQPEVYSSWVPILSLTHFCSSELAQGGSLCRSIWLVDL